MKNKEVRSDFPIALAEQPYLKAIAALKELLGVTSIAKLLVVLESNTPMNMPTNKQPSINSTALLKLIHLLKSLLLLLPRLTKAKSLLMPPKRYLGSFCLALNLGQSCQ